MAGTYDNGGRSDPPDPDDPFVLSLTPAEFEALGRGESIVFDGPSIIDADPSFVVEVVEPQERES